VSCPPSTVYFVCRLNAIPIPNPDNYDVPEHVIVQSEGITGISSFPVHSTVTQYTYDLYLENTTFLTENTNHFFLSAFLPYSKDSIDVAGLSKDCSYFLTLNVVKNNNASFSIPNNDVTNTTATNITSTGLPRKMRSLFNVEFSSGDLAWMAYNLTNNDTQAVSWTIQPLTDSGGSLFVGVKGSSFSLTDLDANTTLSFCLAWQELPTSFEDCIYKLELSEARYLKDAYYWYVAFPESGQWVLSLEAESNSSQNLSIPIEVAVGMTSCPDSCSSDLKQGSCYLYRADDVLFNACHCKAGWLGIACTDGRNALSYDEQLVRTLLLTMSNIMFVPCVLLAMWRGFYTEALVYFFVCFMSTFYHACDQPGIVVLCILPYNTLQFSDFLASVSSIWFTLITVARLDFPYLESWLHVFGCLLISVLVMHDRFNIFTFLVPCLIAGLVVVTSWTRRSIKKHECFPGKKTSLTSIVPGVICASVGIALYAGLETEENYYLVHSGWHILMATSVLFLLPPSRREIRRTWWFRFLVKKCQTDVSNKHEEISNNESDVVNHMYTNPSDIVTTDT